MKIYAVEYVDYLGEDTRIIEYYLSKEYAKKVRNKLRQEHKDDNFGIYVVKEIEVKE